jgi:hypothetical protein
MGITERSVQFLGREWLLPIFGTPEGVLIDQGEALPKTRPPDAGIFRGRRGQLVRWVRDQTLRHEPLEVISRFQPTTRSLLDRRGLNQTMGLPFFATTHRPSKASRTKTLRDLRDVNAR